ncbi:MAG: ubiquinol oxidase subunit II [Candidatus Saccharimonadales bacterium]
MKGRHGLVIAIIVGVVGSLAYALSQFVHNPVVLDPKGSVGVQQRDLLLLATLIMLIVVVPVFALTAYIARQYRASNKKATYTPRADASRALEILWWGIPIVIVGILSVIAWQTSHTLDPFRPIGHDAPYRVRVIALEWKWLFLYPDYKTASVNELVIPVGRTVAFDIASDAPMNSFWIPELGGQIYAMAGMSTQLHLVADKAGQYQGVSSNLSGDGFADMKFIARAMNEADLTSWHYTAAVSDNHLSMSSYELLARPSTVAQPVTYRLDEPELYQMVIDKYGLPHSTMAGEGSY